MNERQIDARFVFNCSLTLRSGYCSPNPPNPLSPEERGKNRGLPPLRPCLGLRPKPRAIQRLRAFYRSESSQDFIGENVGGDLPDAPSLYIKQTY